jgi:hypothetical protein
MMEQWIATRFSLMMVQLSTVYCRMPSAQWLPLPLLLPLPLNLRREEEEEALVAVAVDKVHAVVGMCVVRKEEDQVGQKNDVAWMCLLIRMSMTLASGAAAAVVAADGQFHHPQ